MNPTRSDFAVMLQLGYAYNMLHDDAEAIRWFALARQSDDDKIVGDANQAFNNLRPGLAFMRTTVWIFPFYSTRWHDIFGYGQIKTEFKLGKLPFRPYFSTRLVGDTRQSTGGALPQYLSESSFIFAVGVATRYWHGMMGWFEAGEAVSYLGSHPGVGLAMPDYRGGVSFARGWGHNIRSETPGLFFETNSDGVFVSRFGDDFLTYSQNRAGFTPPALGDLRLQFFVNANVTLDDKRQAWANFAEGRPRRSLPLLLDAPLAHVLRQRHARRIYDFPKRHPQAQLQRRPRRILVCLHPLISPVPSPTTCRFRRVLIFP